MSADLEFGELDEQQWPVARRIIAGAFLDEPFVRGMYGDAPVDRFLGMFGLHEQLPSAPGELVLGAWGNGVLLAVATVTMPGECAYCEGWIDDGPADETHASIIDREFRLGVREHHRAAGLPPHSHITTVAVESALRGSGLGGALMAEICRRLSAGGPVTVVLECYAARARFYEQFGFRKIGEIPEPAVPGLTVGLMRADLG